MSQEIDPYQEMSFLELQQLNRRKTGLVKRHERLQSSLYLQRAMRQKFFNEIHRSMEERAGRMLPDLDQHQPFIAKQRLILHEATRQEAASAAAGAARAAEARRRAAFDREVVEARAEDRADARAAVPRVKAKAAAPAAAAAAAAAAAQVSTPLTPSAMSASSRG
jgi:membrane protein involved in colicin uptake